MVLQNHQNLIEMTSNIFDIIAFGVGYKCPRKIHLNTQWGGGGYLFLLLFSVYNVHTYNMGGIMVPWWMKNILLLNLREHIRRPWMSNFIHINRCYFGIRFRRKRLSCEQYWPNTLWIRIWFLIHSLTILCQIYLQINFFLRGTPIDIYSLLRL